MTATWNFPIPDDAWLAKNPVDSNEVVRERIAFELGDDFRGEQQEDSHALAASLCRWVAQHIHRRRGNDPDADFWFRLPESSRSLGLMLQLFERNALAVHTRGAAVCLKLLCLLFDLPAVTYCCGILCETGGSSHLAYHWLTLVGIRRRLVIDWIAFDAFHGVEYRLAGERRTSFPDLLARLLDDPVAPVETRRLLPKPHYVAFTAGREAQSFDQWLDQVRMQQLDEAVELDAVIPAEGPIADRLRETYRAPGPFCLWHLFPFYISGEDRRWSVDDLARKLDKDSAPPVPRRSSIYHMLRLEDWLADADVAHSGKPMIG